MSKKTESYIIAVLIPIAAGALSALLSRGSMNIYESIMKPSLAPPAWLFPVVWTILYALMGIGSAIIYNEQGTKITETQEALFIYALQLGVNFIWSLVFFNLRAFGMSLILLVVLWILILIMILRFAKINKAAAILQIPYLLWVTFAGYLNLMIFLLNS